MSTSLRLTAIAAALSSLALAGCGGSAEASDSPDQAITIQHAYGSLELPTAPERVVTLGLLDTDIALALDVDPIAVARFPFTEDGIAPWNAGTSIQEAELIDTAKAGNSGAELDVEAIAMTAPDLIIATTYAETGKYYEQLSEIAPVLGPEEAQYLQMSWQEHTSAIAAALDQEEAGAALIAGSAERLEQAAAELPELSGHSYTLSLGTPNEIKVMNDPSDASAEIMKAFGLETSATAAALPGLEDGSGSAGVSEETLDAIDADVVMIGYFGEESQQRWESSPLFAQVPAVADGRYTALDLSVSTALRNPSPAAIDYVIRELIQGTIAPILTD